MNEILETDCGVYLITCEANQTYYIGRSNQLRIRRADHLLDLINQRHCNPRLQHTFNKYGEKGLCFMVIAYLPEEELEEYEQELLDKHVGNLECMNLSDSAYGGRGCGWNHSEETKQKLSQLRIGKPGPTFSQDQIEQQRLRTAKLWEDDTYRQKVRAGQIATNFQYTDEHRAKMSAAKKGRPISEEHKANIAKAQMGIKKNFSEEGTVNIKKAVSRQTLVRKLDTGEQWLFDKRQQAADFVGCCIDVVTRSVKEPDWIPRDYPNYRFSNSGV